jgi:pimeloyl-ACP methyl ester carboxylesterase
VNAAPQLAAQPRLPAEPRYFGTRERPLFGHYHAARPDVARSIAVVLCAPIGHEGLCAHQFLRRLAEQLSDAGVACLRFDYDGTGDSAGTDEDPARVSAWIASIGAAIDELRGLCGVRQVGVFGLRLGALLAFCAASERGDVSSLALWAVPPTGRALVRELKALHALGEAPGPARLSRRQASGDEESAGFLYTRATLRELSALDPKAERRLPAPRVLILSRDDLPDDVSLATHLRKSGASVQAERPRGYRSMMNDPHLTLVDDAVCDVIVRFFSEASSQRHCADTAVPAAACLVRHEGGAVCEKALRLGEESGLFTIVSEPEPAAPRAVTSGVVLLNAGAVHRVGPNRMWVTLARQWAARGLPCARLDLDGLGDSVLGPSEPATKLYARGVVAGMQKALDELGPRLGVQRFMLLGLCSGAYAAFHASLVDERVSGIVLINPQTFDFREGDTIDVARRRNFQEARRYRRVLRSGQNWKKALRGQVDFAHIASVMAGRAGDLARKQLKRVSERLSATEHPPLARAFHGLCDRGVNCLLVYCADDPGREHLDDQLGRELEKLRSRRGFRLEIVEGPDHTFTPLWSQELLATLVSEHLERLAM